MSAMQAPRQELAAVTLRDDQALRESALRRFTGRHAHQSHDVSYWRAPHHRLTANGAAPLRSARWPSAAICRAGMHDAQDPWLSRCRYSHRRRLPIKQCGA
jgi:hypothetical protein